MSALDFFFFLFLCYYMYVYFSSSLMTVYFRVYRIPTAMVKH